MSIDGIGNAPAVTPTEPAEPNEPSLPVAHLDFDVSLPANVAAMPVVTAPSPSQVVQSKLDAYKDSWSGPYTVAGSTVSVPAQFRMADGFNDAQVFVHKTEIVKGEPVDVRTNVLTPRGNDVMMICARAKVSGAMHCMMGGPSPGELKAVTQALIDAGKLPDEPKGDLAGRVRRMQWEWGIGIDCTDYVAGALAKSCGKSIWELGMMPGSDWFVAPSAKPLLTDVSSKANVRVGDVFMLQPSDGSTGHRAIVYSHQVLTPDNAKAFTKNWPDSASFMNPGPVHIYEVDASWGAGPNGASFGGARRDTWLYNESTDTWAEINTRVSPPHFDIHSDGPAGEPIARIVRLKP